jgi:phosphatidylinositol glycan class B
MNVRTLKALIRDDRRLRLMLLASLLVQVVVCLTAVGIYHPDQYFQIIEFSSWQLHRPSAAGRIWEFSAHLRPTMQIYLFSGYSWLCAALGLHDPYLQLGLLRMGFGLALFALFNIIVLHYFQRDRRVLFFVLLILNFSWLLPYTRTLYSSEMLSSFLFFGALFCYDVTGRGGSRGWWVALLTGLVFSLAFYARFQTAFAVAGFVLWMLLMPAERRLTLPVIVGLAVGAALNTALDAGFYQEWVFTPYTYYKVNILEGKAASMGTASFLLYVGVLAAVVVAPPLSLVLLYTGLRAAVMKHLRQPFTLAVLLFILGHCLVAHKEERFLFPVLNILPVMIGWGMPGLIDWWWRQGKGMRRWFNGLMGFSIGLNVLLLGVLMVTPYSQAIYFTTLLKGNFAGRPATIWSVERTPFETEHHLPFVYYREAVPNLHFQRLGPDDSVRLLPGHAEYVAGTYDRLKGQLGWLDSMGYQRVLYSSRLLWGVDGFLDARGINTINDIWVLYQKK